MHQLLAGYDNSAGQGNVRLKQAVRNFSDDTQSVFLASVVIEPATSTGEPIHALTIRERKWTVVRSGGGHDGHLTGDATSIVQTYHMMTPEVIYEGYEGAWNKEMLEGSLQHAWNSSLANVRRRLESFLIEQGMHNSKRLQAAEVS